jgi:hypothetical protein
MVVVHSKRLEFRDVPPILSLSEQALNVFLVSREH